MEYSLDGDRYLSVRFSDIEEFLGREVDSLVKRREIGALGEQQGRGVLPILVRSEDLGI